MFHILTLSLLLNFATAASLCDKGASTSPEFQKIKKQIDEKLQVFSNKKIVAERADATLSKLISAKSPLVSTWMKNHTTEKSSEEDIVRAWRSYFATNFILSTYPHENSALNKEIETLVDSITKEFATPAFQTRMQKYFDQAKSSAIETVKTFPIDHKEKILARIQGIKLYWPLVFKQARNNRSPLDIIEWGIAYDPPANEINMGVNALAYPNAETYLAVFAHEIGHSFDSCRWSSMISPKDPWPFQKVGDCLRSDKSVGAKTRDDRLLAPLLEQKKIAADLAKSLKENPTCNKLGYPPVGVQSDQLPETFADWFSAEVMARMNVEDVSNLRSDLCENHDLNPGSSYVTNKLRLTRIYFAQPSLKTKLHDTTLEKNSYCGLH